MEEEEYLSLLYRPRKNVSHYLTADTISISNKNAMKQEDFLLSQRSLKHSLGLNNLCEKSINWLKDETAIEGCKGKPTTCIREKVAAVMEWG